jgi:hypothetical protein
MSKVKLNLGFEAYPIPRDSTSFRREEKENEKLLLLDLEGIEPSEAHAI